MSACDVKGRREVKSVCCLKMLHGIRGVSVSGILEKMHEGGRGDAEGVDCDEGVDGVRGVGTQSQGA